MRRSACTSAQSDQRVCRSLPREYKISEIPKLLFASVIAQASLYCTACKKDLDCHLFSVLRLSVQRLLYSIYSID